MTRFAYTVVVAAAICCFSLPAAAEQPAGDVAGLIADLSGDDFLAREDATVALAKVGQPAIQPLQELIGQSDPEVTWRARRVLIEIAADQNEAASAAALAAIDELAKSNSSQFTGLTEQIRWWRDVRKLPHQQQVQQFNAWLWKHNGGIDPFIVRRFRGC